MKFMHAFCFFLFGFMLININTNSGYLDSMYGHISFVNWLIFFILYIYTVICIVYCFVCSKNKNLGILSVFLFVLCNLIIVILPYLSGYIYSGFGDQITHITFSKYIHNTGKIFSEDIYPSVHLLLSFASHVFGMKLVNLAHFVGPWFYILYILFSYTLLKKIFSKNMSIIGGAIASILLFYYYVQIFPMACVILVYPIVFYLYYKKIESNDISITILILIIMLSLVFFHPFALLILLIILFIFDCGYFYNYKFNKYDLGRPLKTLNVSVLSFIFSLLWLWSRESRIWNRMVNNAADLLVGNIKQQAMIERASNVFSKLNMGTIDKFLLFMELYGHIFILVFLSLCSMFFLREKFTNKKYFLSILYISFLIFLIIQFVDYVFPLSEIGEGRYLYVVSIFFPVLVTLFLYGLTLRVKKNLLVVMISFVIFAGSIIGLFSIYPSPRTYGMNDAVTKKELNGVKWLYGKLKHSDTIIVRDDKLYNWRYKEHYYGFNKNPFEVKKAYFHYGYDVYNNMGDIYNKGAYFVLSKRDIYYPLVYSQIDKYRKKDLNKIKKDETLIKIYSNDFISTMYIL